jgi:hypothetical protein
MGWLVLCSVIAGAVGFCGWRVARREARASHEYWSPGERISLDSARSPGDVGLGGGIGDPGGGGDG